jgi:DNA-directed RNA polymerase subunit RPC12/RpoP
MIIIKTGKSQFHKEYLSKIINYYENNIHSEKDIESIVCYTAKSTYYYIKYFYEDDKELKKVYLCKSVAYKEKMIDKKFTLGSVTVLAKHYYNLKEHHQIIELYKKHKKKINDRKNISSYALELYLELYNLITLSMIFTHNIQLVEETVVALDLENLPLLNTNDVTKTIQSIHNTINMVNLIQMQIRIKGMALIEEYDLESNTKMLKDSENRSMCLICLENIERSRITIVECINCNKYISHVLCMYNYILHQLETDQLIKCPYCRHKY